MEIRSAPLLSPLLPDPTGRTATSSRPAERVEETTGTRPQRTGLAERVYQGEVVEEERSIDYGELLRRARFESAGAGRFEVPPDAPYRSRQALTAYAANSAPSDVELMPRVDDFV